MKNLTRIVLLFLVMAFGSNGFAQSAPTIAVEETVNALIKAMIDADKNSLENLSHPKLSYGHSGGKVDDQKDFVNNIVSGKSDFVSIDITNQTISISNAIAVVRHDLFAKTNDGGKPGEVHLKVLLVFEKQKGKWLLIARQAVKPPAS